MRLGDKLDRFIRKYKGKRVGTGQCVALIRPWLEIMTGDEWSIPRVIAAKQMYDKASPRKWRKVRWNGKNKPPLGAIVVFNSHPGNQWGHVAIARKGSTVHEGKTVDQHWSLYKAVSLEIHRYKRDYCIGWLVWRK